LKKNDQVGLININGVI